MSNIAVKHLSINHLSNSSRAASKQLTDSADQLNHQLSALSKDWTGSSYDAFRAVMKEWDDSATSLAEALSAIAGMLDQTADAYAGLEGQVVSMFTSTEHASKGDNAGTPPPLVKVPPPPPPPPPYWLTHKL